jgi:hypothetical protein
MSVAAVAASTDMPISGSHSGAVHIKWPIPLMKRVSSSFLVSTELVRELYRENMVVVERT